MEPLHQIKIKICGITNEGDACAAVEAGADALGFVFFEKSARYVDFARAAKVIGSLPAGVAKVGVFVNASAANIRRAIEECGIDTVQFHGDERSEFCVGFEVKTIKAFRVRGRDSLEEVQGYGTDAWLLDTYVAGQIGGTGLTFNWDVAREATGLGRPVILAGGLTVENVREACSRVHPYGVDVSSGVEMAPGRKDKSKVREFIEVVRSCGKIESKVESGLWS